MQKFFLVINIIDNADALSKHISVLWYPAFDTIYTWNLFVLSNSPQHQTNGIAGYRMRQLKLVIKDHSLYRIRRCLYK